MELKLRNDIVSARIQLAVMWRYARCMGRNKRIRRFEVDGSDRYDIEWNCVWSACLLLQSICHVIFIANLYEQARESYSFLFCIHFQIFFVEHFQRDWSEKLIGRCIYGLWHVYTKTGIESEKEMNRDRESGKSEYNESWERFSVKCFYRWGWKNAIGKRAAGAKTAKKNFVMHELALSFSRQSHRGLNCIALVCKCALTVCIELLSERECKCVQNVSHIFF